MKTNNINKKFLEVSEPFYKKVPTRRRQKRILLSGLLLELLFILYRLKETGPAQTVIKYIVIFSAAFILLIITYILIKKKSGPQPVHPHQYMVSILFFAFLFQLTLLPSPAEMSDDIYRYLWDGKLQHFNINPYAYAPEDPLLKTYHSKDLPSRVNFPEIKTIYPPLTQLVFRLSYFLFGESVTGLKFLFVLFQLGTCLVFYLLLLERKQNPALLLLFAWNPLVIMETAVNGHLDVVMVFFLLLSLLFYHKSRYVLSGITFAGAVLSKLIPVILLPLFLFYLFREGKRTGEGLLRSATFLISFLLTAAFFYMLYWGPAVNMFLTALNYSSRWFFNNPLFRLILLLTKDNPLAHLVSFSLFLGVFLFIFFSRLPIEKKIFYTAFAFILSNPTIHPWYVILLVGLLCITYSDAAVLWSGLIVLSYTVVYRFKLTGEWNDSWTQMVLQYTPLLIAALTSFLRGIRKNRVQP